MNETDTPSLQVQTSTLGHRKGRDWAHRRSCGTLEPEILQSGEGQESVP